jgi:hypothetical protein
MACRHFAEIFDSSSDRQTMFSAVMLTNIDVVEPEWALRAG